MRHPHLEEVRHFWFEDACTSPASLARHQARWFAPSDQLDRDIEKRFGALPEAVRSGALSYRPDDAHDLLTVILILDMSGQILYDIARGEKKMLALIIATVSHEMRNPLNSIINECKIMSILLATLLEILKQFKVAFQ